MSRALRRSVPLLVLALVAGCGMLPRTSAPVPNSAQTWAAVLAQAEQQVYAGHYASADRLLAEFHQAHLGTPEAPEALFYRALFRLDPANPSASPQEAIGLLDAVVALRVVSPHRNDAIALRRIAVALDAKPVVVNVTAPREPAAATAPRAESGAKDEEIARLREDLAKANAELERIRRRLATPKP